MSRSQELLGRIVASAFTGRWKQRLTIAALAVVVFLPAIVFGADGPRFIGDVEEDAGRWEAMQGISLEIEGRVSTVSRGSMRFQGSRLPIVLPENERPRGGSTYRVLGALRPVDGKTVFVARKVEPYPSDEERLAVAEARLKPNEVAGWFELADEYARRAKFYRDDALKKRAEDVVVRGLAAAASEAGDDVAKLRAAADLAIERGFSDQAQVPLHRMTRLEWSAIQDRFKTDRDAAMTDADLLIDRVGRDLTGASEPMTERREALESAYGRDPLGVFARVDAEQRKMIARILYADIMATTLAQRVLPNDSNAEQIADELSKRLPDRPDLAEAYRERSIAAAMESLGTMSEADLTEFRKKLTEAGKVAKADEALDGWLAARLESARQRGPSFIFEAGKDYERLKADEDKAVELFLEALELDSRLVLAEKELEQRGFEKVGGRWRKKAVVMSTPGGENSPVEVGEVREGMTDDQVRSSFRTAPDSVARIASFGEVTEVWVYRDFKRVVTLRRIGNDADARVVDVSEIK